MPVTVELSAAGGVLLRLRSTKKTTVAMTASATRTATMIQVLELELPPGVHSAVRVASPSTTKSASGVMSQVAVEPSVEVALLSPSEPGPDTLKTIEKSSSRLTPSSSVMSAASPPPVSSSTPCSEAVNLVPDSSCSMLIDESCPEVVRSSIGTPDTVHFTPTSEPSLISSTSTS